VNAAWGRRHEGHSLPYSPGFWLSFCWPGFGVWSRCRSAGVLICGVVIPQPVYGQLEFAGLFAAINTVLNTINGVLKSLLDMANNVLNQIQSIFQAFWNLMDTVVYPKALIARAKAWCRR